MREIYEAARQGKQLTRRYGQPVHYLGIGTHLRVYNATPPLWLRVNGKMRYVSVGRVEHPDDWAHSRIMFFEMKTATVCHLLPDAPVIHGEDPAVTTVGDKIVLSSVNVSVSRLGVHLFETEFRRADDVMEFWNCWTKIPGKDKNEIKIDEKPKLKNTQSQLELV